ncbi:MAG: hypothetical protein HY231_02075 [Acidobacteria bacterium]|nr:hypothetical protein [Acidobacteriota bacterium]
MKRRHFITIAGLALLSLSLLAWRYWWMTRRALIRLKLRKPPANLLRNADFALCTNADIPDYWGTSEAAALEDFSPVLHLETASPLKNVRALRLHNPQGNFDLSLQSCATFVAKPQPYTFSVYLRSDVPECKAALSVGWGDKQALVVNQQWQRYQLCYTPQLVGELNSGFQTRVLLQQQGNLWLAAPQLEVGTQATAFVTALMDDHPLPVFPTPEKDEYQRLEDLPAPAPTDALVRQATASAQSFSYSGLLQGGKPVAVFGIALGEIAEWKLADIANQGFTTVTLFFPAFTDNKEAEYTEVRRQLDLAHQHGLNALVMVTHERDRTLRQMLDEKLRFIARCKAHPAILGWLILDEPTQHFAYSPEREGCEFYQAVKKADPTRAVVINENVWRAGEWLRGYVQATDIISMDLYPVGQYQNPLSLIAERVGAMSRTALSENKPLAFWLQLYGNYDAPREPTPAEQSAMTYLVFIHGVRLLLYWLYKPMSPALWASMKPLLAELKILFDVVSQAEARWLGVGTLKLHIHFAVWQLGDGFLLVACNISDRKMLATFDVQQLTGKGLESYESWHGDSVRQLSGNRIEVAFAPYERQVFRLR